MTASHHLSLVRTEPEQTDSTLPPHDLDAEAAYHGMWMCDPERFALYRSHGVQAKHFYSQANARIWAAACELDDAGKLPDAVTVASRLRDCEQIQGCGGAAYLGRLMSDTAATDVAQAARRIIDLWRVRHAIATAQRFCSRAYARSWGTDGPQDLLNAASRHMRDIAMSDTGATGMFTPEQALESAARRQVALEAEPVRTTGLPRLDWLIGDGMRNECIVVLAKKGVGKSSLTRQIGLHVAQIEDADGELRSGLGIISVDGMDAEQVTGMALAQLADADVVNTLRGRFTEGEWARVAGTQDRPGAMDLLRRLPLLINDEACSKPGRLSRRMTATRLAEVAREMAAEFAHRDKRLSVLVVDLLQRIVPGPGEERFAGIEAVAELAPNLASELGCSVLLISHENKDGDAWGFPQLSGNAQCVWRLRKAESSAPTYAGPTEWHDDGPGYELAIEKMRIPCREPDPCVVGLDGCRKSLTWAEHVNR